MINEQIRDKEVRLIGPDGAQLGIVSSREAFAKAQEAGLDLVKIAPQAKPPVCKIIDYGKYRYELSRKEKEAKKKQKTIDIKEVRLSPNIDTNDLKTKVNAARKFLSKGDRVKVTLRFRGREMAHMASSKHVLDDFAEHLADVAVVANGMAATTGTKSKKWGKNGEKKSIIATVTVKDDGGTSVAYTTEDDTAATNKFATYMAKGSEK